jgi:hypothetical protein
VALVKRANRDPLAWGLFHPEAVKPWITRGFVSRVEAGSRLTITVDRDGLSAYRPESGECVDPLAAVWLYEARTLSQVCSEITWCVACGVVCRDGHFSDDHLAWLRLDYDEGVAVAARDQRLRQWCDQCVSKRRRPRLRWCAAEDCTGYFWPRRANELYCSGACRKRRGARDRERSVHGRG